MPETIVLEGEVFLNEQDDWEPTGVYVRGQIEQVKNHRNWPDHIDLARLFEQVYGLKRAWSVEEAVTGKFRITIEPLEGP